MKPFEYYVKNNEVRTTIINEKEIFSLVEDAYRRFTYFSNETITEINAKFVFENIYESIRELLDAILHKKGYKSYSHQASIAFAHEQNLLSQKDAFILDKLRDLRNKSKYYGKNINPIEAKSNIEEGKRIFSIIKDYLQNKK